MNKKIGFILLILAINSSYASSLGNKYVASVAPNSATTPTTQTTKLLASVQTNTSNYTTYSQTNSAGVVITQYVDTNGNVFAVTWNGETLPDLEDILGQYFKNYKDNSKMTGLHSNTVNTGDLVVQNTGHVRAFKGVAYLKSLLPVNFTIQDI